MSPSAMAETATNGVLDESIASAAPAFTTDCLIVGTGPAGGALSMFLAQNGEIISNSRIEDADLGSSGDRHQRTRDFT